MIEKRNYIINSRIDLGNEPINGQAVGKISECRYGLFPAGYNACEMIAVYNLLKLNGYRDYPFADICFEMYKKSWAFWGLFGSNVFALYKFYKSHGIPYIKTKKYKEFLKLLDKNNTGMLSFWNGDTPFKGIHTVCIKKDNNSYIVYNMYNNVPVPVICRSFAEITLPRRFIVGYAIEKKPN